MLFSGIAYATKAYAVERITVFYEHNDRISRKDFTVAIRQIENRMPIQVKVRVLNAPKNNCVRINSASSESRWKQVSCYHRLRIKLGINGYAIFATPPLEEDGQKYWGGVASGIGVHNGTATINISSNFVSIITVARHELGHLLGAMHDWASRIDSIMHPDVLQFASLDLKFSRWSIKEIWDFVY